MDDPTDERSRLMSETEKLPRIAKVIAASGLCSRRDAEKLIAEGRVKIDGTVLRTPATLVSPEQEITVNGKPISQKQTARLWKFHKPRGVITSHKDELGRQTIFDLLPPDLRQLHSIGRLDYNSEGLLLLTNDGALKREFELPASGIERRYRVRILGKPNDDTLRRLREGVTIEGVQYQGIGVKVEPAQGRNCWVEVKLYEGKNREIRRLFEHFEHQVSKLVRTHYGNYGLGSLPSGKAEEVFIKQQK